MNLDPAVVGDGSHGTVFYAHAIERQKHNELSCLEEVYNISMAEKYDMV